MVKRLMNVFLSLLLLFTTMFVADNRVYAQEETTDPEFTEVLETQEEANEEVYADDEDTSLNETGSMTEEAKEEPYIQEDGSDLKETETNSEGPVLTEEEALSEVEEVQEGEEDNSDPSACTTIIQDPDTKDLYIDSRNTDWLKALKNKYDSQSGNSIIFSNGSAIELNSSYNEIPFVAEDDGTITRMIIKYETLLSYNIASGIQTIHFPAAGSFSSVSFELDFELSACKDVPEGLIAEETEEGIIFRYEELDQEKEDFLSSLLTPTVWESYRNARYFKGSSISIYSSDSSRSIDVENEQYKMSAAGSVTSENKRIVKSDDGNYVLIPRYVVNSFDILNNDSEWTVSINAYGYNFYQTSFSGMRYADEPLKDDFAITIEFDGEGNLIIRSNDENWLEAACKIEHTDSYGKTLESGSSFRIYNREGTGWRPYFRNRKFSTSKPEIEYELKTDGNGEKYIYVSKQIILRQFSDVSESVSESNQYYISFDTVGYEDYSSDSDGYYFGFPDDYFVDISGTVSVSQDDVSKDIWVTSTEENWLRELYSYTKEKNSQRYIYFKNGYSISLNGNYNYIEFVLENSEIKGFYIRHEALLATHVASGADNRITFPSTETYTGFTHWLDFDLDACKQVPEGLKAEEREEGIRLYYDDPGEEEKELLAALTLPSIRNDVENQFISEGSQIYLESYSDGRSQNSWFSNTKRIDVYSGETVHETVETTLSDDGTYVLIKHDAIIDSGLYNSEETVYVNLRPYGYETSEYRTIQLPGIRYGCRKLNEDFEVSFSFDEQGALIIRSNDPLWNEAMDTSRVFDDNGWETRQGSVVSITNKDTGNNVPFFNENNKNSIYVFDIRTDENNEKYIYISKEKLMERFSECGEDGKKDNVYYIYFTTYGYQKFNSSDDKKYFSFSEDLLKTVPDIVIEENENGDIIFTSGNKDENYLSYIRSFFTVNGAWIGIMTNNGNGDDNRGFYPADNSNKGKIYISDNNDLVISHDHVIEHNISNGEKEIALFVPGYAAIRRTLTLNHASMEGPAELDYTFIDGDLLITSSDPKWVESFKKSNSYIELYRGSGNSYKSYDFYSETAGVTSEGNQIRISKQALEDKAVTGGTYTMSFRMYGYETVYKYGVVFESYAKTLTDNVTVSTNDGELWITCEDTAFLDALVSPQVQNRTSNSWKTISDGGHITIRKNNDNNYWSYLGNYKYVYEDGSTYESTYMVRSGKKVIISNAVLQSCEEVFDSENIIVKLHAHGYGEIVVSGVKIEGVRSQDTPDNVKVSEDEDGNIIISADDEAWLKSLIVPNEYSGNDVVRYGGFVSLRKLNAQGKETQWNTARNNANNNRQFLIYQDGKVIIKREALIYNRITVGDYNVYLYGEGFAAVSGGKITLTKACKTIPEDLKVEIVKEGLMIYGDKDYLESLALWTKYDKDGNLLSNGSVIYVYDENYNYKNSFHNYSFKDEIINNIVYDEANSRVVVRREFLNGISGEGYRVRLDAYGYESTTMFKDFPLISVPSAKLLLSTEKQFEVNTSGKVNWSVDNTSKASVDENGLLKALGVGEVILSAQIEGKEFVDSIPVSIVPPGNISFSVTPVKKDVVVGETCQIIPKYDTSYSFTVRYSSSDESLATVDENGLVTFLEAGKVTITSTLYEGKSCDSVFTVYPVAKGEKLTAVLENYGSKNGIEVLDSTNMIVKADGELVSPEDLTYTSANETIASVDKNGKITAHKVGTVKITARLNDDPSKRSVNCSVKIISRIVNTLNFKTEDGSHIIDSVEYDENNDILYIRLDARDAIKQSFDLNPLGKDKNGEMVHVDKVTYSPVDTSVLSVSADGKVNIRKAGQTLIRASVSSNPKEYEPVNTQIIVRIVDYTPVLESAKVTVGKYFDNGTDVKIHAIKGSEIENVTMVNAKTNETDFITSYKDGVFNIKAKEDTAVKTYNEILYVLLKGETKPYEFKYTVAVSSVLPKTTVKATGTYNTVLGKNTLGLSVQSEGDVRKIEFVDNWALMDEEGNIQLKKNEKGNYVLKGAVKVFFEGYSDEKAFITTNVTFKTEKTIPVASLQCMSEAGFSKNTVTLNSNFQKQVSFELSSSEEAYPITSATIKGDHSANGVCISYQNGTLRVWLDETKPIKDGTYKYTIDPEIAVNGSLITLKSIPLTVKVSSDLPKLKLSSSAVKFNRNYHESIVTEINCENLPVGAIIESFTVEEEGIIEKPVLNDNTLCLTLKAGADGKLTEKGTYSLTLIPKYSGGITGTPVSIKVSVIDVEAKASAAVKGNLNQFDPDGAENCTGTVKLSNVTAEVKDVKTASENIAVSLNDEGKIVFTLKKQDLKDQTLKNEKISVVLSTGETIEIYVSLKVARKAPAVKLETATLNVYDTSYQGIEVGRVTLSELPFGKIKDVWFSDSLVYDLSYDKEENCIVVYLKDAANMKAGAASNITIKIDYVGDYGTYEQSLTDKTIKGLKTTTLKLSIKDASTAVKAK